MYALAGMVALTAVMSAMQCSLMYTLCTSGASPPLF
jgi:hypothetical protein